MIRITQLLISNYVLYINNSYDIIMAIVNVLLIILLEYYSMEMHTLLRVSFLCIVYGNDECINTWYISIMMLMGFRRQTMHGYPGRSHIEFFAVTKNSPLLAWM